MIEELKSILHHHVRLNTQIPGRLNDGISLDEIRRQSESLPFALPEEVEQLFQWRNGTNIEEGDLLDARWFFPGFYFPSLQEAIRVVHERRDAPQWREGWFPVFMDGAGNHYLSCCRKQNSARAEIVGFLHGEPEQVVEYESLEAMIKTLEACFAEGAFFLDDRGVLDMDDEHHREIAHRFNPGIEEWQD